MELRKEKIKMPSILGWLIVGMIFGPHAINLMPQIVLSAGWYKTIIMWMQCAFGVMLGSELIWSKLKTSGKALVLTTLAQSLRTFAVVSLAFGIIFAFTKVSIYLAFVYITARAFGKYFGARSDATFTHMSDTVRKYLGLTLLPHSGVSLVFTGIICSTLASAPELVQIVQGTIAAAAVINEFIAVIAAKKGFELAGEIKKIS